MSVLKEKTPVNLTLPAWQIITAAAGEREVAGHGQKVSPWS